MRVDPTPREWDWCSYKRQPTGSLTLPPREDNSEEALDTSQEEGPRPTRPAL